MHQAAFLFFFVFFVFFGGLLLLSLFSLFFVTSDKFFVFLFCFDEG